MHKVTSVVLDMAEGPFSGTHCEFTNLTDASKKLSEWSPYVPMGYDKCDFKVTWDDGETYDGRYDLHHEEHGTNLIGEQIHSVITFEIGLAHPTHISKAQYEQYILPNQECRVPYIFFLLDHETGVSIGREITAEELADLPEDWNNPTVDTTKYYQCALRAWEVTRQVYDVYTEGGGLSQERNGKFYIA